MEEKIKANVKQVIHNLGGTEKVPQVKGTTLEKRDRIGKVDLKKSMDKII